MGPPPQPFRRPGSWCLFRAAPEVQTRDGGDISALGKLRSRDSITLSVS